MAGSPVHVPYILQYPRKLHIKIIAHRYPCPANSQFRQRPFGFHVDLYLPILRHHRQCLFHRRYCQLHIYRVNVGIYQHSQRTIFRPQPILCIQFYCRRQCFKAKPLSRNSLCIHSKQPFSSKLQPRPLRSLYLAYGHPHLGATIVERIYLYFKPAHIDISHIQSRLGLYSRRGIQHIAIVKQHMPHTYAPRLGVYSLRLFCRLFGLGGICYFAAIFMNTAIFPYVPLSYGIPLGNSANNITRCHSVDCHIGHFHAVPAKVYGSGKQLECVQSRSYAIAGIDHSHLKIYIV